jgi:PAS domain S-box-containing protein
MGIKVAEWNAYPLFDEQGQYAGLQGTGRDITERKQMEDTLRESEARYRLLTENTSDLIWTVDLGLRYTYMSPAITRMRGYTPEEVVGVPVAETMTPASLEEARKTLAEQLAMERMEGVDPNRATKMELEMYCKDGSTIWTEMNMTFLRDSDGKPVGILGVTRNISERKQMEDALRRQEYELAERAKELNCLYGISVLVDKPGISLQEILQGTADLIPAAWQYPEVTCARIIVDGQEFRTANFKETAWRQASNITVSDQRAGSVEVYYLDKRPESDEGPFLKEERTLINAVGERLGHITERKRAQDALAEHAQDLARSNRELDDFDLPP